MTGQKRRIRWWWLRWLWWLRCALIWGCCLNYQLGGLRISVKDGCEGNEGGAAMYVRRGACVSSGGVSEKDC